MRFKICYFNFIWLHAGKWGSKKEIIIIIIFAGRKKPTADYLPLVESGKQQMVFVFVILGAQASLALSLVNTLRISHLRIAYIV